jgi:trk system potassium uptake protein TrkA
MKMVIIGGGKTGYYLAERFLAESHDVTIIEQRRAQAVKLDQDLLNLKVVQGDACDLATLEAADIASADLVAAVTGDDEDNLVVAMLAKHFSAARIYARVNHPRNEWLFDADWGVDVAFSAPALLGDQMAIWPN